MGTDGSNSTASNPRFTRRLGERRARRTLDRPVACPHHIHVDCRRPPQRVASGLYQPWRNHPPPSSGTSRLEWWLLVAPRSQVIAWQFWASLELTIVAVTAGAVGARVAGPRMTHGSLRRFVPASRRVVRTAHWARSVDLRSLRGRPGHAGVFLLGQHGRRSLVTQRETSVLVIGPTRSGKTAALVIPNLLDWEGPAIATSTKSELVDVTAGHRQSVGPVYVYDPTGAIGDRFRTVTWSPIAGCGDLIVPGWSRRGSALHCSRAVDVATTTGLIGRSSGKLLIAPLLYVAAISCRTIVDVRPGSMGSTLRPRSACSRRCSLIQRRSEIWIPSAPCRCSLPWINDRNANVARCSQR